MNNIQVMIWLFPILFIFHDFEEIIFIQVWIDKNKRCLGDRYPVLSRKLLSHFENITTASFAFGVAEEFMLISIITIISYIMNWYSLWMGLFIAFTLHLIIHCFQVLILKKYVPAVITSIICLPICIFIIKQMMQIFTLNDLIWYSVLGFIIMVINLMIVHKFMDIFSKWLAKYRETT